MVREFSFDFSEKRWPVTLICSSEASIMGVYRTPTENEMKTMNHRDYPKSLKVKSSSILRFIIKDCQEAISINPTSENVGYYADEICYCAAELSARKVKGL